MANREITYYSLLSSEDLRHIESVADEMAEQSFVALGFEQKWFDHLWISANNEAFLEYISLQNDLNKLGKILGEQLKLYARKQGEGLEQDKDGFYRTHNARKDWLNHTTFICRKEYNKTQNEVYNEVAKWCIEWQNEWLESLNPYSPTELKEMSKDLKTPLWEQLNESEQPQQNAKPKPRRKEAILKFKRRVGESLKGQDVAVEITYKIQLEKAYRSEQKKIEAIEQEIDKLLEVVNSTPFKLKKFRFNPIETIVDYFFEEWYLRGDARVSLMPFRMAKEMEKVEPEMLKAYRAISLIKLYEQYLNSKSSPTQTGKHKPELNRLLITFKNSETIEKIHSELKGYFPNKEAELLIALQGEQLSEILLFPHNQNKFVEVFRRLKYNGFLLNTDTETKNWICTTFQFVKKGFAEPQPFKESSVWDNLNKGKGEPTKKERICITEWLPYKSPVQLTREAENEKL